MWETLTDWAIALPAAHQYTGKLELEGMCICRDGLPQLLVSVQGTASPDACRAHDSQLIQASRGCFVAPGLRKTFQGLLFDQVHISVHQGI